jgi:hypothetical protein
MEEKEFDSLRLWRQFEFQDAQHGGRLVAFALALWGRTPEDLRRQLLAPTPEVPPGCGLANLKQLEQQARLILAHYTKKVAKFPTILSQLHPNELIVVGGKSFNVLEARCEVGRRAIQYLENR